MSMEKLSPRDRQRLAAYVDGELSPRARAKVTQRIAQDPDWQQALEEMQALKTALQNLPRPRPRRDFILSAAQVEATQARLRRTQRALAYRWAGAVTVILLAFVVVGSWMSANLAVSAVPRGNSMVWKSQQTEAGQVEALAPAIAAQKAPPTEAEERSTAVPEMMAEAPQVMMDAEASKATPKVQTATPCPLEEFMPEIGTEGPTSATPTACASSRSPYRMPEAVAATTPSSGSTALWRWPWGAIEGALALAALGFALAGFWGARRP